MKISSVIYRTAASTLLATLFVHAAILALPIAAASPATTAASLKVAPPKQALRKKPVKKVAPKPTPTPPRPTPVPPAPTPTPKPAGDDCDCGL